MRGNPLLQSLPLIISLVVFFYFIVLRPQQKDQERRRTLLAGLKKNDKVVTIGGIIGTIVDLAGDGSRVTLKVDDGTRIKFLRSSIQGPYDEKSETDSTST
ncbi:MAG: preprotein translocase subunit YajC [Planctomycetaceae bacterium]|nr:preprotein translocase subunit YajC [Planctomycetaceae bacterium]